MIHFIPGGVCAAQGFSAAGIHVGVKVNSGDKKDLALIYSEKPCTAAGIFTRNKVKAAPVRLSRNHVKSGTAQAVAVNSGNANACAPLENENALAMCQAAAQALSLSPEQVLVASTGVIGRTLPIAPIQEGMPVLAGKLAHSSEASDDAAHAIMTTDTQKKEVAVSFQLEGKEVVIGGIAKGSGMIHPNMGTMLCFLTTDCAISPALLQKALASVGDQSFNRISVDGDTSTNDSCIILANGMAGVSEITEEGPAYDAFCQALLQVCVHLARAMAKDGEGARHLITCTVSGAESVEQAQALSKSVISSTLTKAAIFGCDANWGRVLCAMGYAGVDFDPTQVDVTFASQAGKVAVCQKGQGLPFDEDLARKVLTEDEVEILITLSQGDAQCTCWGCDITYDYIKINGDYRT